MATLQTGLNSDCHLELNSQASRQPNRLFFCDAHDQMGESFSMYVRACTHEEAARRMIDYWRVDDIIEDPDDIEEEVIQVYEVPNAQGDSGVLNWDDFDRVYVPKLPLF